MKNKEYFYRDDIATYKPKFLLLCEKCRPEVKKYDKSLAQKDRKTYIYITEIK